MDGQLKLQGVLYRFFCVIWTSKNLIDNEVPILGKIRNIRNSGFGLWPRQFFLKKSNLLN